MGLNDIGEAANTRNLFKIAFFRSRNNMTGWHSNPREVSNYFPSPLPVKDHSIHVAAAIKLEMSLHGFSRIRPVSQCFDEIHNLVQGGLL